MADNVAITPGSGATVAADDIGGVLHQRVKLSLGADGTANDASAGAGAVGTGTQRVTLASDDPAVASLGATNSAAAASDTATADIGGRLQRIAQRITSMIALLPASLGTKSAATSFAVALSTEDAATLTSIKTAAEDTTTPVPVKAFPAEYEKVAASQTDQMMGPTGAVGDKIEGILVIPATTSPGEISIEDGSTNTIVFAGGASSVLTLHPFWIPLNNIVSVSGGWEVSTGANVSCIVFGDFT